MSPLTTFGACAVTVMLVSYALEHRSAWCVFVFALACAASSLDAWLAGTRPFGVVEGCGRSSCCAAGCCACLG